MQVKQSVMASDKAILSLLPKNLTLGAASSLAGRIFNIVSQLAITAILSRSLDGTNFGVWSLLYTIYTLVPSFDLGLGQSLRLKLAQLNASEHRSTPTAQNLFFSTVIVLLVIGLLFGITAVLILKWFTRFDAGFLHLLMGFALICGGTLFLNLSTQVFYSYGEAKERALLDIFQSLLLLLVVCLTRSAQLSVIILAYYSTTLLFGVLTLWIFVWKRHWKIIIPDASVIFESISQLWHSSWWFWLLSMLASAIFGASSFFVASTNSLEIVGSFIVLQRLYSVIVTMHLALLAPLQSIFTHALVTNNWRTIRLLWQRSSIFSVTIGFLSCLVLGFAYKPIIQLWTGKLIDDPVLVVSLGLWSTTWIWINMQSITLSGLGIVKPQALWFFVGFLLNTILSLVLTNHMGVIGSIIATIVSILPIAIVSPKWIYNTLSERSR